MEKLKKVLHWLDENLESTICMILMVAFCSILFLQVVMRKVFNNSLSWSEELARYIFIWMVFIGISYGAKQMKHLKIDVFLNVFPKKIRGFIVILADVIVLTFGGVVVFAAYITVSKYLQVGTASPAMHIPYWFIHSAPMVGYALTIIRQVQTIIYRIKVLKSGGSDIPGSDNEDGEEALL